MKTRLIAALTAIYLVGAESVVAEDTKVSNLAWMTGHWCSDNGSEHIEEIWTSASGGMLLGMAKTTKGDRVVAFEFLRIVTVDSVPSYIAQPGGAAATPFRWTAGGSDWARFENPEHDFPKRIEYRRTGDTLKADTAGPAENGSENVISFRYQRCAAPSP